MEGEVMTVAYALGSFKFVPQATPAIVEGFEPTQARPGSKEKMKIIRTRIQKGVPLHHPEDKKNIASVEWWRLIDEDEEFHIPPEAEEVEEEDEAAA